MTQPYKICPNCQRTAPADAVYCPHCGIPIGDARVTAGRSASTAGISGYDSRSGETDLWEADIRAVHLTRAAALILLPVLLLCSLAAGFVLIFSGAVGNAEQERSGTLPAATMDTGITFVTNTPRPSLALPTVTPQPPTPTPTETPGPCRVTVQPGDGLIGLASRCGHRSMDVIPLILELNGLSAPESIQVGQQILIPWPTPTLDPNAPTPTPVGGNIGRRAGADLVFVENVDAASSSPPTETPTPTPVPTEALPPGVTWHVVQPNENMIIIASIYNTNAETLAQLNPEISFSQCDFSLDTGGPRCTVLLRQGQRMRVPAPTPTPTLSPTLSGSETPTPTATPTFNAPSAIAPPDRALFGVDDIITLRWITTGALGPGERYRVIVRDLTAEREFSADTTDLLFIIPVEWQGADQRLHVYEWTVSVIREQAPDSPLFTTNPQTFSWQGRVRQ